MKRYLKNGDELYTAIILEEDQRVVTHKGKRYKSYIFKNKVEIGKMERKEKKSICCIKM